MSKDSTLPVFTVMHAAAVASHMLRTPLPETFVFRAGHVFVDGEEAQLDCAWSSDALQRQLARCLDHFGIGKSATHCIAVWAAAFEERDMKSEA